MRKAVSIFACLILGLAGQAEPRLVWLNPSHDFGAFREEIGLVSCTFKAVNTGTEPVAVIDARANCGCTRPTYPRDPIAPGDTLSVSVSYDPSGRPGRFRKQIKVTTNDSHPAVLSISGTVIGASNTLRSRYPEQAGDLRYSNSISPFGETKKGHVLAAAINIYNPTADTIVPVVANKPQYINVLIRPEAIPPGEQGTASMTAYTDRAEGWGLIEDSLTIVLDSRRAAETSARIRTVMIVNEDFSKLTDQQRADAPVAHLSESSIDFGTIAPGATVDRTFTVTNTGRSPLLIRRLYSPDDAVTVKASAYKVNPGKNATVTVTVDPAKISPDPMGETLLNARITLISNAPDMPSQIVRAVGVVK